MNELSIFNKFFNGNFFDDFAYPARTRVPSVDVKETKDAYTMEMDLPGKTENDVHIELDNNVLSIESRKEEKNEESGNRDEKGTWLIRERRVSEFSRRFTLPEDADGENVSASFKNGVLSVNIPRKAAPEPKKITISAA